MAYDMEAKRNCAVKELFPQGIVTRTMDGMNVAVVSTDKQETFEHSKELLFRRSGGPSKSESSQGSSFGI